MKGAGAAFWPHQSHNVFTGALHRAHAHGDRWFTELSAQRFPGVCVIASATRKGGPIMSTATDSTSRTAHLLALMKQGDDAFNSRDFAGWTRSTTRT